LILVFPFVVTYNKYGIIKNVRRDAP